VYEGRLGGCKRLNVAVLIFSSPVQHRNTEHALDVIRLLVEQGGSVNVFLLGDGVYNSQRKIADSGVDNAASSLSQLRVTVVNCSTCARLRGIVEEDLIGGAKNGSLEDLVEFVENADIVLSFTEEI
jgi:sulfur relay (sulfurtransferase) complex TusBCD TusD component (DsrE family)